MAWLRCWVLYFAIQNYSTHPAGQDSTCNLHQFPVYRIKDEHTNLRAFMNPTLSELLNLIKQHSDAQTMAVKVLPSILACVGADNGSLILLSGDRVVHKVLATKETFAQVSEHKLQTVLAEGLAGWALRHRQGGLASNTELDERWTSMGSTEIASAMVVPMMSRDTVIGLIAFHHSTRGQFRERDLANAAELADTISPMFDIALLTESTLDSLTGLCRSATNPSAVVDWQGNVKVVNEAMKMLDIAWEGVNFSQSLLPRELNVVTIQQCEWDEPRKLMSLPFHAHVIPFRGFGAWVQLTATGEAVST
ncbi:MAG: GAF domain-containing protein [Rhodoferax sp.]|nr:GAF domain-containing protein [Rhodoferax sp.]